MNRCANWLAVAVAMLPAVIGCSSESPRSSVKGMVTLDGQPMASGLINFVAVDAGAQTAEAVITEGRFEAVVPPGEKRVEIRAPKITGKKKMYDTPDSPTVDVVAELLPRRYNVDSELRMTVADGEQDKSFELTSD